MYLDQLTETIHACRFCFMCRHLSPVGNVTFREADTPRGRALMAGVMTRPGAAGSLHPDFADAFYRAELSGACRTHCVSHYDENGVILAARRDLVERNAEPTAVRKLAETLRSAPVPAAEGKGEIAYLVDPETALQPDVQAAVEKIFAKAGTGFKTIRHADAGKALRVLGYAADADKLAARLNKAIADAKVNTVVVSCPGTYDALKNDTPPAGVKVLHSSELILELIQSGKLKPSASTRSVYPLPSDYLKNYQKEPLAPEALLRKAGMNTPMFGTNTEESYSAGEAAMVLDVLYPEVAKKLAERVLSLVDRPDADTLAVFSPYTRRILRAHAAKPENIVSIEELIAALL